ncbi:hemagglutinin/amebocyte aggregation factor [Plakobranchus ocellatus]|uniref:Hemagglutinin/amebocyte aggregation factor n=1 Tax=Plakobranchus ocellatus TaxID=259542 RepID=A0AAV4BZV7_9GAST|nr:hemagglutinin/amebocyte aggregation factor [Plakobranchus ocellatus]
MHTVATTIFITVLLFAAASGQFVNDWDRPFTFQCRHGYVLKSVYSEHSNHKEDRRWAFRCSRAPNGAFPTRCYWTGYVNYWDAVMNYVCNRDFVIAGVHSVHDNRREDRRFRFKCCSHHGFRTHSCTLTPYINRWDLPLSYVVPSGQVFAGWASVHSNHRE